MPRPRSPFACLALLVTALLCACQSNGGAGAGAEAAALLPDGLPVYPGARVSDVKEFGPPETAEADSARGKAGRKRRATSLSAVLETGDSPDQVIPAYVALLETRGWKPQVRETQGDRAIVARRGRQTALFMVRESDGGSKIDLLLVKKARKRKGRRPQAGAGEPGGGPPGP